MGRSKEFSEEQERQAIYNYVELHQGLQTAGKNFGISQYNMEKILKKYGVKKRTYTEAKQIGRKYTCNDDYFKIQTKNMAYILGLIASDGNISKKENRINIELSKQDADILEKIRVETEVQRPLAEYIKKQTGHEVVVFINWSASWKQDLAHYGIVPNKTFILKPPYFLAEDFIIDYIRGYFDGDGSIYHLDSQNRVFFEIVGASKEVIDWIQDKLVNQYHIFLNKKLTTTCPNGTIIYEIKIGNIEEIQKIYHLFYDNGQLFLQRKKDKFESLLNIPRDSNSSN